MNQNSARKARTLLRFTDGAGNVLSGCSLKIEQTEHEFLFGCGAFDAIPAANEKKGDPFYEDRMKKWTDLYNFGTMSFYWGEYEVKEGEPEFESRMNASRYLTERGKTVKGHPLCWHTNCADWLMKYDNYTILNKQLDRVQREVSAFRGVIDMWDAINEVVIMPEFDRYDNAITRICRQYGRVPLVKEVFAAAKAANPDVFLLINDFDVSERYAELIDQLLEADVPLSAIGIQTHQHQGYMGTRKMETILERFGKFGLPLHFTENTLVSGHLMPPEIVDLNDYQIPEWPTTPEGEERQARDMEEMYRLLFAHPLVEAITGWDFTDGAWLGAPSGVLTTDNRKKPSYEMLKRLIHEEWHTSLDAVTDENGCVSMEGYKGSYIVKSAAGSAEFRLTKGQEQMEVVLVS